MSFSVTRYLRFLAAFSLLVIAQPAQPARCNAAAVFEKTKAALAEKRYDEAAQFLDELRMCTNLSPVESFELGWLYGRSRHFDTALGVFNTVPPDIPDQLTHAYAIALSQFELAEYKETIATLQTLRSKAALDEKSANLLAVSLSKLGQYREAYAVLSDQMQANPADLTSYLNLVTVCAEGGDFKAAADIASRATHLFPAAPEVFIVRGAANTLLGDLDAAYRDFARSVELAPARPDAHFFLALTDYKEGKFAEGITILRGAIGRGLRDSDLHYLLAECLLKANAADTETALRELNLAVNLNATSTAARTLRGKLLLDAGHPAQAVVDLEFANQHEPGSRSVNYNLARAYRALGRGAEAQEIFDGLRGQSSNALVEMSDRRLNKALADKGNQKP